MSLGITFHEPVTNIQRSIMEFVKMVDAVIEINRNLLPSHEAEVPLFEDRLVLRVIHSLKQRHNVTFQIHQIVNVTVDLRLQI